MELRVDGTHDTEYGFSRDPRANEPVRTSPTDTQAGSVLSPAGFREKDDVL